MQANLGGAFLLKILQQLLLLLPVVRALEFVYQDTSGLTPKTETLKIDTTLVWDRAEASKLAKILKTANTKGATAAAPAQRKATFGFTDPTAATEGDLTAYDVQMAQLLLALDPRSSRARKAVADSGTPLTNTDTDELDEAIGLVISSYEERSKDATAAAPTEFTDPTINGADILAAIKRIFTATSNKDKFDLSVTGAITDVFSTDQAYEKDRLRELRVAGFTKLLGMKAATHAAMQKLAAVFDNYILGLTTTAPETVKQQDTIKRVQEIEKDPLTRHSPDIFAAAIDANAVEKMYVDIRRDVPLYDKEASGAGAVGNQMPKMRDSRFRQAIKVLNDEFLKKIETLTTPPFHGIQMSALSDMIKLEAPETGPLEMFGINAGAATPVLGDLDQSYKRQFDKVNNEVRKKAAEGPAFNFWAKEVLKKLGSDFNKMFATPPLIGLTKEVAFATPVDKIMLDGMSNIEGPDPPLFGTPPVDITANLEKNFNAAKVKTSTLAQDKLRAELAKAKFDGMVNRLDFDNELLDNEYLHLAMSTNIPAEVISVNTDLTAAAKEVIWPATPPRVNTLGLTAPVTIADVDKAFSELYAKLGFDKVALDINFKNFLEIRQKFVEQMVKDYVSFAKMDGTLPEADKNLLKDLEALLAKTGGLEILKLTSTPGTTKELDKPFADRLIGIEKEVMAAARLGPLKEFSTHVLPSIKQKIIDAFDRLYDASPKPDDPQPPNDLRKKLQKAEKDAKQLLLKIAPGGTIFTKKLDEIEKQYTDFVDTELKNLLKDPLMADFNGLRRRVDHSLNSLNKAYLELVPAQVDPPPAQQAVLDAAKKASDILAQPSLEEMLGLASGATATLAELDTAFQSQLNSLNLADPEVAKLSALNSVIDELVLRGLDNAYAVVGKQLLSKPPLSTALNAIQNGEGKLDELVNGKTLGGKTPFNKAEGLVVDKKYFDLASKLSDPSVLEHAGLLDRAKRLLKKLNTAYDRVVAKPGANFFDSAVPTASKLHGQLKAATAKRDADLFVAKDIVALSKEYMSQKDALGKAVVDPKLNVYPGLKLRAKAEKERLSRAFFLAAFALSPSISDTKVKKAVDEANRIIGIAKYEDILGGKLDSNSHLEDIDKAYLEIFINTLNLEEDPLTSADYIGLNQALDIVVLTKMGNAYRNLTESILMKVNNQKLDPAELGMFKTLDLVESATNDVETLTEADKFSDKTTLQQLDEFYRARFEAIRNGRNGQLAALEGLVKRSKRAKQKMNLAYDALTNPATAPNGQKLTPPKAVKLQELIVDLEKPEHTTAPRALFSFTGTLDISDIDKLEEEFMKKKKPIMELLADKSFTLPGLRLRASEAIERLKALKDQIYEDFFSKQEEKDAWHLVVEVENAHSNAFQIFGLTKDTLTQAALDKKKKELDDILKLNLFDDPSMQKLRARAEGAQRAIRTAFDQLKALIPGLRPAPGPGGPGQRPPSPTPLEEQGLAMEFNNNPPPVEPANQCVDTVMNCRLELCKLRGYVVAMHKNCRRTCSVCFPAGQPCVDNNRFDCPTWKAQGFCNSKVYSKGMKMRECAATCGLCPLAAGRR